jgi:hypothetical protein
MDKPTAVGCLIIFLLVAIILLGSGGKPPNDGWGGSGPTN